jgi:hypothetical protein
MGATPLEPTPGGQVNRQGALLESLLRTVVQVVVGAALAAFTAYLVEHPLGQENALDANYWYAAITAVWSGIVAAVMRVAVPISTDYRGKWRTDLTAKSDPPPGSSPGRL